MKLANSKNPTLRKIADARPKTRIKLSGSMISIPIDEPSRDKYETVCDGCNREVAYCDCLDEDRCEACGSNAPIGFCDCPEEDR